MSENGDTGMDSIRSLSLPPNTTPWAAKTVNISPKDTAITGMMRMIRLIMPMGASWLPKVKLYTPEM